MLPSILTLAAAAAFAMPQGSYQGQGQWHDDRGHTGVYTVATVTGPTRLASTYDFAGDAGHQTADFSLETTAAGFFRVDGADGSGYCWDVQCHYSATLGGVAIEETLTFVDGKLYKLGSKVVDGVRIAWQEELSAR